MSRRSIRRYIDKEIPKDVLNEILEAGRQSPSAVNKQPIHFVIVSDPGIKEKMAGLVSRFIKNAP